MSCRRITTHKCHYRLTRVGSTIPRRIMGICNTETLYINKYSELRRIQNSHLHYKANIPTPMTRVQNRKVRRNTGDIIHKPINPTRTKQPSQLKKPSTIVVLYLRRRHHSPSRGVARNLFEIVQSAEAHRAQAVEIAIAVHLQIKVLVRDSQIGGGSPGQELGQSV